MAQWGTMRLMELPGRVRIVDDVPHAFARIVAEIAPRSIAFSGGDLAQHCYAALRAKPLDWLMVDVYFGDERIVPVTDDDSNEGMVRRTLLDHVQPHAIHSMVGAGADAYDVLITQAAPIEIVHLGLGPDGHTASLFPGSPSLNETERLVIETGDELHPHPRITFTFPAIARAQLALITVQGEEKRDAIQRIRNGEDLPGARVRAHEVLWLGDAAALAH